MILGKKRRQPVLLLSYSPTPPGIGREAVFVIEALDCLRQVTIGSVMLRLTLAMLFGGMIGLERGPSARVPGRSCRRACCAAA